MAGDHKFYYDFESEIKPDNWTLLRQENGRAVLQCTLPMEEGDFVFLAPCFADTERYLPHLKQLSVNGEVLPLRASDAVYVHSSFARYGIDFHAKNGENLFTAELSLPQDGKYRPEHLFFSICQAEKPPLPSSAAARTLHRIPAASFARDRSDFDTASWAPGVGHKNAPGRFGFSKGDGLLDCAMPSLGVVDKMFLCGQEKYRKPYRWNYSLLPEDMKLHGSYAPSDAGIDGDGLEVSPLSVRWRAMHEGKAFSCTYSLASPAILTENEAGSMRLSNLRFAGNYQSVLIPRRDGIEEAPLAEADLSGMTENWILLFNSTEFPDCPLMLVFSREPSAVKLKRTPSGRLGSMEFSSCSRLLSCTPFGIQRFDPGKMDVSDAVRRCRFWSRALLAFPVRCREYFRLDEENERVTVRQKFEYRYLEDAWGTEPLELAPFPPPLSICGTSECRDAADFEFPTKYGHLRGRIGTWSEYTLPFMPPERKFPLRGEHSAIPDLLRQGMEKYKSVAALFGPDKVSYPYAGAILEPYAFPATMSFFLDPDDRDFLRGHLTECLKAALDPEAKSEYTVIDWGTMMRDQPEHDEVVRIYHDPERKHITIFNWYDRVEPFTGARFKICYLNVGFFSRGEIKTASREEILNLKIPLIENDWGVGLTFYYLYLSALTAGSFREVRKNWPLLKQVYSFFDLMHDWACMGTGYSDNAITWVEGANYGLFPAYIRMAEAAGDPEARAFGIYNAAKQLALRLAIMRASQIYFPAYFETDPWFCAKHFHEEATPNMAFQNVPDLYDDRLRRDGVYNFTTEGLYPEAYTALRKFGGGSYTAVMDRLEHALLNGLDNPGFRWGIIQQFAAVMIDHALSGCSEEKFSSLLDAGLEKDLLMKEWRGIHIFSRVLPENYLRAQLLAWMEMRRHKLWLEHWEEMRIDSALWRENEAVISFSHSGDGSMRLICGVTAEPESVSLDGIPVRWCGSRPGKIELHPASGGTLRIVFPR